MRCIYTDRCFVFIDKSLLFVCQQYNLIQMNMRTNIFARIGRFYMEGFREMTLGRTLWAIILLKLFVMFFILKLFFFPSYLGKYSTREEKQEHVAVELTNHKIINH